MTQANLKTKKTAVTVKSYLDSLSTEQRKQARALMHAFKDVAGARPKMWGKTIVGYGEYHYTYDSGREGDFLATGFSIRKSGPTVYIMPGYNDYSSLLKKLGPHSLGKAVST